MRKIILTVAVCALLADCSNTADVVNAMKDDQSITSGRFSFTGYGVNTSTEFVRVGKDQTGLTAQTGSNGTSVTPPAAAPK